MKNVKSLDMNIPIQNYKINLQGFTVSDLATMFNVNVSAPDPTYYIEIDTGWAGPDGEQFKKLSQKNILD